MPVLSYWACAMYFHMAIDASMCMHVCEPCSAGMALAYVLVVVVQATTVKVSLFILLGFCLITLVAESSL